METGKKHSTYAGVCALTHERVSSLVHLHFIRVAQAVISVGRVE